VLPPGPVPPPEPELDPLPPPQDAIVKAKAARHRSKPARRSFLRKAMTPVPKSKPNARFHPSLAEAVCAAVLAVVVTVTVTFVPVAATANCTGFAVQVAP